MRKGPNNASRVVWALGEFFLLYSCFFLYTNDLYRYYLRYTGKNDDNRPKRRDTRRLGTRWVFFWFIRVSPNILTMFNRFFYRFQDEGTQTTSRLGPRARHTTQHWHHTTSTSPTKHRRIAAPPHHLKVSSRGKWRQGQGLETQHVLSPWYVFFSFFKKLILIFVYIYSLDYYYHHLRRLQQQYRAQTTRIVSFGPLVSCFKIIIHCFFILITIIFRFSNDWRDPNDGYTFVWVLGLCITHSHHHNTTTTTTLPRHHHTMPPPPPQKHLQGPNNSKTVVRAQ